MPLRHVVLSCGGSAAIDAGNGSAYVGLGIDRDGNPVIMGVSSNARPSR